MKFSIKDFFILGAVTVPMFHSTCPKAKETKHTAKYLILKQVMGIFFRIQENFTNSWAVVHVSLSLLCIKKKNEDINLILLCSNYHSFISQNGHAHSNNSSANFRWIVWVFDHFVGLALKGFNIAVCGKVQFGSDEWFARNTTDVMPFRKMSTPGIRWNYGILRNEYNYYYYYNLHYVFCLFVPIFYNKEKWFILKTFASAFLIAEIYLKNRSQ